MKNQQLGPYELRGELGRGAMARVWRAYDPKLAREVAIKEPLFDEKLSDDILAEMAERFVKEGRAAARLNHSGIVAIYAADIYDSRPAIVMELVDGITLGDMLESGPISPITALQILDQLLDAVGYAHSQGVVHRDIKPDNIFITSGGHIKLGDFGIAHLEDSAETKKTQLGTVLGTPGYMAPEQATGAPVDNRTDLFAIGTIAYEMLSGYNPFGAGETNDSTTLLYRIVHQSPQELALETSSGLPNDIRPAILAALNKNPNQRPQDAAAFKAMLYGAPAPLPGTMPAPLPGTFVDQQPGITEAYAAAATNKKKRWLPYAIVAAVGLIVVIGLIIFALDGSSPISTPQPSTSEPSPSEQASRAPASAPAPEPEPVEAKAGKAELTQIYNQIVSIDGALATVIQNFNVHYGTDIGTRQADYANFQATVVAPYSQLVSGLGSNDYSAARASRDFNKLSVEPEFSEKWAQIEELENLLYQRIDLMDKTYQRSLQFDDDVSNMSYINEFLSPVYELVGDGTGGNNQYNAKFRQLLPAAKP